MHFTTMLQKKGNKLKFMVMMNVKHKVINKYFISNACNLRILFDSLLVLPSLVYPRKNFFQRVGNQLLTFIINANISKHTLNFDL